MRIYLTCIMILAIAQSCVVNNVQFNQADLNRYDFVDSMVYQPQKKILIGIFSSEHDHKVNIALLQRSDKGLSLFQVIDSLDSQFGNTEPILEDFNHDGLVDMSLPYGAGARSANTLSYLFIQEPAGTLKYIKGSSDIPNIAVDSTSHLITGTYYYAGMSFVDFEIDKDTLVEISGTNVSVDSIWTIREHYKIENRKQTVIKKDSIADNGEGLYVRYQ